MTISDQQIQLLTIEFVDLDRSGMGIGFYKGIPLLTEGVLPGELAEVEVVYRGAKKWFCNLKVLLRKSEYRVKPDCPVFSQCGGCSLQHLDYSQEITLKSNQLQEVLRRVGQIYLPVEPVLSNSQRQKAYRNRAIIPLSRGDNGKIQMGYYKRGSHKIVDINSCLILDPIIERILLFIKNDLIESLYNLNSDSKLFNCLRHIVIRCSSSTNEILLTLVSNSSYIEGLETLLQSWYARWENLVGITLNVQAHNNNVIFGKKTYLIFGRDYLIDKFLNFEYCISSTNFFQINTPLAERTTELIVSLFSKYPKLENIIDTYCGIGSMTLPLSLINDKVIGIEINNDSITSAKKNAVKNVSNNIEFICGDVSHLLTNYLTCNSGLLLDPPRKGLDQNVVDVIINKLPIFIAYLSCHPATLARDLKLILDSQKYKVSLIQPIDFFPQTIHLECLVTLERLTS